MSNEFSKTETWTKTTMNMYIFRINLLETHIFHGYIIQSAIPPRCSKIGKIVMCSNTLSSTWTEMHFILRLSVSPCQSPNGSPASRSCGDQITSRFNTWTTTLSWEYAWHSERTLGTTRWLLRMWTARIPWKSKLSFSVSLLNVRGKIEVTEVPQKMQEKRLQWFGQD